MNDIIHHIYLFHQNYKLSHNDLEKMKISAE